MSFIEWKYFSEWKYVIYRMKIFLANENIFSEWKYVIYRMKIFLANENMSSNENMSFIEWKYF